MVDVLGVDVAAREYGTSLVLPGDDLAREVQPLKISPVGLMPFHPVDVRLIGATWNLAETVLDLGVVECCVCVVEF